MTAMSNPKTWKKYIYFVYQLTSVGEKEILFRKSIYDENLYILL